jgi:hypothetical protein
MKEIFTFKGQNEIEFHKKFGTKDACLQYRQTANGKMDLLALPVDALRSISPQNLFTKDVKSAFMMLHQWQIPCFTNSNLGLKRLF